MPVRSPQRRRPAPAPDRYDQFLALVASVGAMRAGGEDARLRDGLRAEFEREFAAASRDERSRAMAAIDRACGVGR